MPTDLAPPIDQQPAIRQQPRGQRTASPIAAALLLATLMFAGFGLAGCGTGPATDATGDSPQSAESEPASSSAPSTSPGKPAIDSIPDSAMLQPSDLRLASRDALVQAKREPTTLITFRLCDTPYPSDAERTASLHRSLVTFIAAQGNEVSTHVEQQVSAFRGNAAGQRMTDLRERLKRCPGKAGDGTSQWTLAGENLGGDESLLIKRVTLTRFVQENPLREQVQYVAVVRSGNLVVLLADNGWETGDGHEDLVRRLVPLALRRLADLR